MSNSNWVFNPDIINSYAYWDDFLSKKECESIIKIGKDKKLKEATVVGDHKNIRESKVSWIYPEANFFWLYEKLTSVVLNLNSRFFNFNLTGFLEPLQFTNYRAPGARYGKHVDRIAGGLNRKLSFSILLSNPKNYKGGEFYLYENENGLLLNQEQGKLIIFPSFSLHEVTPVTKGERNSLVGWVTGDNFK
jgi:PKHD-type hydroxylase